MRFVFKTQAGDSVIAECGSAEVAHKLNILLDGMGSFSIPTKQIDVSSNVSEADIVMGLEKLSIALSSINEKPVFNRTVKKQIENLVCALRMRYEIDLRQECSQIQ